MELTEAEIKAYLASVGIDLPEFMITILMGQTSTLDECLIANGVDPSTAKLIKLYLFALLSLANGGRYVTSQTAPSGASRSFKYPTLAERWSSILTMLRNLDKYGCATELTPADPTATHHGFFGVARGTPCP